MKRILQKEEIIDISQFGAFSPYWTFMDDQVLVADTAEEIIRSLPKEKRIIDPVAVLELLQFNYMLGNRTIIQGVQRVPWHSTLKWNGTVTRQSPIPHNNIYDSAINIAHKLEFLLETELFAICNQHKNIFMLLTGGLDSRIIAGVLKNIEKSLQINITCVTWGLPNSRDVNYARRIASWFDWRFINIPYDAELTWLNIQRSAIWGGCEATGIHLHGMDWFKVLQPNDLVIAASFGDSIGRAEFSSHHLRDITIPDIQDQSGLIQKKLLADLIEKAQKDRSTAWQEDTSSFEWAKNELNLQENYMRRMLCHTMNYIRQFCTLHQAFTSDNVVSYMWSLSPNCRTNDVYFELLKILDQRLYSLPWARNGIAPDGTIETDTSLRQNYHDLGVWFHNDLKTRIEELLLSPGLGKLGIFNTSAIKKLFKQWNKEPHDSMGSSENIIKLCSIELARKEFELQPYSKPTYINEIISKFFPK